MCGIAGFISQRHSTDERESVVHRMMAAMYHRGPDSGGCHSDGPATLGMRRLAIFDPANGLQPMHSPDGRWHIVFNGAIYNHLELRTELEASWHFQTQCDTEVLLAALVRWGENALPRLRGMFGFALWDSLEKQLLLARDPLGIKPVFFHHDTSNETFVFASEIQTLRSARGIVPDEINAVAVASYLAWFAVPAPDTLYRSLHALRPGECLRWKAGRIENRFFWNLRDAARNESGPICETQESFTRECRLRLEETVLAHMAADVPVGAFLSGGLDSTLVCALMQRASGQRLKTFSIGFAEKEFSEADSAAQNARFLGTEHHAFTLTPERILADLSALTNAFDHPSGDGINTYYASLAAREGGVTVALSGLGADELFGGYPSFKRLPSLDRLANNWKIVPRFIQNLLLRRLDKGNTGQRKLADCLRHGQTPASLALQLRRVHSDTVTTRLAKGTPPPPHPFMYTVEQESEGQAHAAIASVAEMRGYMTDVLLADSDMMSMRHSLELRVPFVDVRLATWLYRQRPEFRFDPVRSKGTLFTATQDVLPPELQHRPKQGFTLPFARWMRAELRPFLSDVFSQGQSQAGDFLDFATIQHDWLTYQNGGDDREWSRLWSLAMLICAINRPAPQAS